MDESNVILNFRSSLAISPCNTCGISSVTLLERLLSLDEIRAYLFCGKFLAREKAIFTNIKRNDSIRKKNYLISGPKRDSMQGRKVLCNV